MAKHHPEDTFTCNNCGGEVRMSARICPHCGADDETGWKADAKYSHLTPDDDDDFDYNEFVRTEIHGERPKNRNKTWIWVVAIVLLGVLGLSILKGIF